MHRQRLLWYFVLSTIVLGLTLVYMPKAVKRSFAVDTYRVGVY